MTPLDNLDRGLATAQPPAAPVNADKFWYSTDTNELSVSIGTAWTVIASGPSSAPLSSPQTDVGVDPYVALLSNGLYTLSVQVTNFTLPAGAADTDLLVLKDYTGNATAAPHTINPAGGDTIDHLGVYTINGDNDAVTLAYNTADSNWMVL